MKPGRRLALRREALCALDSDHLVSVVGGTHIFTDCGCVTHGYSCDDCPIPSLPINTCLCLIGTGLSCNICLEPTRER